MLWKLIVRLALHFRPHALCIALCGLAAYYLHIDKPLLFLFSAFSGLLFSIIEKAREMKLQLELEERTREKVRKRQYREERAVERQPSFVNWRQIFSRARMTFTILGILLLIVAAAMYTYFYITFRAE